MQSEKSSEVALMEEKKECCVHENKVRSEKEYKDLINRLNH